MSIGAGHSLRGHRATLATRLVLPPLAGLNCPEPDAQVTLLQAYELFKNAPKAKRLAGTYSPSLLRAAPTIALGVLPGHPQAMRRDRLIVARAVAYAVGRACG